jgi:demethylmenaquinone methyltransferase/2-methoxy-6-polyprenyl-1,4-benzoquinol methylase
MALNSLPTPDDKHAAVRTMFDRIAPRYDRMNRLLTVGLDQRWRRAALDAIRVGAGDRVLDLAAGTGDLAELAQARGARVIAVDFAGEMLRSARARGVRAALVQADAERLPVRDGSATVAVCGFALRNFVSLPRIFRELARVIAKGGRVAFIEVDRPTAPVVRQGHAFYFDRVVPFVGGLLSDRAAYSYLPQSTAYLPPAAQLLGMLEVAGFEAVERRARLLGAVQILTGVRGEAAC